MVKLLGSIFLNFYARKKCFMLFNMVINELNYIENNEFAVFRIPGYSLVKLLACLWLVHPQYLVLFEIF